MAFWNKKTTQPEIIDASTNATKMDFSTPYGKIGKGNLVLPYTRHYGSERFVRFGIDNLYPQIMNQLYQQSALNHAIIDYKVNAIIGGGFGIESADKTAQQKIKEYAFVNKNKFNKLIRQSTNDLILHGRIIILVNRRDNGSVTFKRVMPEKVRNNADKSMFLISEDWALYTFTKEYPAYDPNFIGESVYLYEIDITGANEYYPLPAWTSAANACELSGDIPSFHRNNIINSIYPAGMIKLGKKFGSQAETNAFIDSIKKASGPVEGGRMFVFMDDDKDALPTFEAIKANDNSTLFLQTREMINEEICFAHQIDPLLVGIRVGGKLGSGTDITIAYTIFEKNVVMPNRELVIEFANELLQIGGLTTSELIINNYQIVDNKIVLQDEQISKK